MTMTKLECVFGVIVVLGTVTALTAALGKAPSAADGKLLAMSCFKTRFSSGVTRGRAGWAPPRSLLGGNVGKIGGNKRRQERGRKRRKGKKKGEKRGKERKRERKRGKVGKEERRHEKRRKYDREMKTQE